MKFKLEKILSLFPTFKRHENHHVNESVKPDLVYTTNFGTVQNEIEGVGNVTTDKRGYLCVPKSIISAAGHSVGARLQVHLHKDSYLVIDKCLYFNKNIYSFLTIYTVDKNRNIKISNKILSNINNNLNDTKYNIQYDSIDKAIKIYAE